MMQHTEPTTVHVIIIMFIYPTILVEKITSVSLDMYLVVESWLEPFWYATEVHMNILRVSILFFGGVSTVHSLAFLF